MNQRVEVDKVANRRGCSAPTTPQMCPAAQPLQHSFSSRPSLSGNPPFSRNASCSRSISVCVRCLAKQRNLVTGAASCTRYRSPVCIHHLRVGAWVGRHTRMHTGDRDPTSLQPVNMCSRTVEGTRIKTVLEHRLDLIPAVLVSRLLQHVKQNLKCGNMTPCGVPSSNRWSPD